MSDETIQYAISCGVFLLSLSSVTLGIVNFVSFFRGILRENERLAEEVGRLNSELKRHEPTVSLATTIHDLTTRDCTVTASKPYFNSQPYAD